MAIISYNGSAAQAPVRGVNVHSVDGWAQMPCAAFKEHCPKCQEDHAIWTDTSHSLCVRGVHHNKQPRVSQSNHEQRAATSCEPLRNAPLSQSSITSPIFAAGIFQAPGAEQLRNLLYKCVLAPT